jgi:hypothetical protein
MLAWLRANVALELREPKDGLSTRRLGKRQWRRRRGGIRKVDALERDAS